MMEETEQGDQGGFYLFHYSLFTLAALGLVLLAVWLRLWRLALVPPGLWFDEAYNAMDAVWLVERDSWPVFLLGNNGREALYHYLLALSISILGKAAYSVRLVSAFLGVLSIPFMYRWVLTIFKGKANVHWLALFSMAGLVTSFWYLIMNRAGYRANLLPLFILFANYFFWRGWQTGKTGYYLIAGMGLGLGQYTYLSARLFPLVFILFICIQTLLFGREKWTQVKRAWVGLVVMGSTGVIVSIPLLLFFADHPDAFWGRVGDVVVKTDGSWESLKMLGLHLWQAGRVFVDGQDPNLRHHLLGRSVFNWFNTFGFVVGLFIAIKSYRHPVHLFLLLSLFVMWLPAPLSDPAFHTLRLSGILPAYYVIVAIGLVKIAGWIHRHWVFRSQSPWRMGLATLSLLLLLNGGLTFYDYFYRWAKMTKVYEVYDGPVVDLADYFVDPHSEVNLIIPFYLYTHASMRYLLDDSFEKAVLLPEDTLAHLRRQEMVSMVIPEDLPDDGKPPAYVWLQKGKSQAGIAYVSTVRRDASLTRLSSEPVELIKGSRDNIIARRYNVDTQEVISLFPQQMPRKNVVVEWADNLLLTGYEFYPATIEAGSIGHLFLSWKILGHTGLKEKMFLQLLDSRGNPIAQQEIEVISRKMYRWRDDELILEQHPLKIPADLSAGLYFARLGFFDPGTGQRVQAYGPDKYELGDEIIVGPLYVYKDNINPLLPEHLVQAMLGNAFEVLGYSLSSLTTGTASTEVEIFWKTHSRVDTNYTVFVQLLDEQNRVIAQHDTQPLPQVYSTSQWQQGDILSDRFILSIPSSELSNRGRLVTGMYDLSTGVRLPAYDEKGELLPDGLIPLIDE